MNGTQINYYFLCHRKLWLFYHRIDMEQNSDTVAVGKVISQSSYKREDHEIKINNDGDEIVLDFYDVKNKVIHEVKKSDKMEEPHIWQVKFYISVLEAKGIQGVRGEIDYPKLRTKINVELTDEDKIEIVKIKNSIQEIVSAKRPAKVINKSFCKSCSYYDLCYV